MNIDFESFVDTWRLTILTLADITLVIGAVIGAFYLLGLASKKTAPDKYRYISKNEIKYLWFVSLSWSFSIAFFLNALIVKNHSGFGTFEFVLKTGISVAVGFLLGYVMRTYFNTYYPFTLEKRLSAVRFKKRYTSLGKEMRLLNEDEEDEYLTKEMIAHEDAHKFDYDVWLDEQTGETHIDKYDGDLHLLVCENCRFRTLKLKAEYVKREAAMSQSGLVSRHFECSYCGYSEDHEVEVAALGGKQPA